MNAEDSESTSKKRPKGKVWYAGNTAILKLFLGPDDRGNLS